MLRLNYEQKKPFIKISISFCDFTKKKIFKVSVRIIILNITYVFFFLFLINAADCENIFASAPLKVLCACTRYCIFAFGFYAIMRTLIVKMY